jgi:hypothetical protein
MLDRTQSCQCSPHCVNLSRLKFEIFSHAPYSPDFFRFLPFLQLEGIYSGGRVNDKISICTELKNVCRYIRGVREWSPQNFRVSL